MMANHLTPEELSKELGIAREEVIRLCLQEGVPIYQGKIDKFLFQAQLKASAVTGRLGLRLISARAPPRRRAPPRPPSCLRSRLFLLLRLGDAAFERLHQVDHGRLGPLLGLGPSKLPSPASFASSSARRSWREPPRAGPLARSRR